MKMKMTMTMLGEGGKEISLLGALVSLGAVVVMCSLGAVVRSLGAVLSVKFFGPQEVSGKMDASGLRRCALEVSSRVTGQARSAKDKS